MPGRVPLRYMCSMQTRKRPLCARHSLVVHFRAQSTTTWDDGKRRCASKLRHFIAWTVVNERHVLRSRVDILLNRYRPSATAKNEDARSVASMSVSSEPLCAHVKDLTCFSDFLTQAHQRSRVPLVMPVGKGHSLAEWLLKTRLQKSSLVCVLAGSRGWEYEEGRAAQLAPLWRSHKVLLTDDHTRPIEALDRLAESCAKVTKPSAFASMQCVHVS